MNRGSGGPTPLGIVIFVVLVIIVMIGAFFLFVNGGQPSGEQEDSETVLEISANRAVRMEVFGNIVADEERQSYAITVTPDSRTIEVRQGYANRVENRKTFRNSTTAYEEFVYALEKLSFDATRDATPEEDDPRGTCATGQRYVFTMLEYGDEVDSRWTTSCEGSQGTFSGDYETTEELFRAQIPEARDILRDTDLR